MQLATWTMRRVHHWVRDYTFDFNGMHTSFNLNVLPLGSYNMILGMDSLFIRRTKVDFCDKAIKFLDDDGTRRILKGKQKPILVRMVTTM